MITPEKLAQLIGREFHDESHCLKCKAFPDLADTIEALWKEIAELKRVDRRQHDEIMSARDTNSRNQLLEAVARAAEEMEREMVVSDGLHDALKMLRESEKTK